MFKENFSPQESIPEQKKEEERNEIENRDKARNDEMQGGRFRFYASRKDSENCTEENTEERIQRLKKYIIAERCLLGNIEKDPEIIEEIHQSEDSITKLAEEIGVQISKERFPNDDDIHIHDNFDPRIIPVDAGGRSFLNEIAVRKSLMEDERRIELQRDPEADLDQVAKAVRRHRITHELIHLICTRNFFLGETGGEFISEGFISFKSIVPPPEEESMHQGPNSKFFSFAEGLTETMAGQIDYDNSLPFQCTGYINHVIFVTELARDMAIRLNGKDPRAVTNPKIREIEFFGKKFTRRAELGKNRDHGNPEGKFTEREILGYFEAGMLNGDRGCLNILSAIYGKAAINALSTMGFTLDSVINTTRAFKLNSCMSKLEMFNSRQPTPINIGRSEIILNPRKS